MRLSEKMREMSIEKMCEGLVFHIGDFVLHSRLTNPDSKAESAGWAQAFWRRNSDEENNPPRELTYKR